MSSHTPGPWKAVGRAVMSGDLCLAIARHSLDQEDDGGPDGPTEFDEIFCNAALMSAAVAMKEALEDARTIITAAVGLNCVLENYDPEQHPTVKLIDAALAQAKGDRC